jgi:uncharacterized membrane protein
VEDIGMAWRNLWAGGLIGFAVGGFFDGILLHQLLQWHHLLSGWRPGDTVSLMRMHITWDGVFHAAHYLFLAFGLALLWPRPEESSGRRFGAWFAIGFGLWHVVDAVLIHWILGMHRIRQDADNPLFWDLLFFGLGVVAMLLGALWLRRGPRISPAPLAVLAILAGGAAALPAGGPAFAALAMPEGAAPDAPLLLAVAGDATLAGVDPDGRVWIFAITDPGRFRRAATALGATAADVPVLPGGCLTPL